MLTTTKFDYMASVSDARSLRFTEEDLHAGNILLSAEAHPLEFGEVGIVTYIHEHFLSFLKLVHLLRPALQELIMSYYLLSCPQTILAGYFSGTQTVMSLRLRKAVDAICFYQYCGQQLPTEEQIAVIVGKQNLSTMMLLVDSKRNAKSISVSMTKLIHLFCTTGSYAAVARACGIHRPEVRRTLNYLQQSLLRSPDAGAKGLAAHLYCLLDATPSGIGSQARIDRRQANIERRDPDVLGEFRVRVDDPGFEAMFVQKSSNTDEIHSMPAPESQMMDF